MKKLIFSVEDVDGIREIIECAMESAGFDIAAFENSSLMFEVIDKQIPDLILLDIMLPGIDGVETLKILKRDYPSIPVIMVSAKDSEFDKVELLNLGASDYMTKPFGVLELIARVRANLKRRQVKREIYGDYILDEEKYKIVRGSETLTLTNKEFKTLALLIKAQGAVVDKETLIDEIWGGDYEGETRTLNMVILRLRAKLGENAIETVRGKGFRLI